jgi:transcriptional regulator with XRE-family HTH domain
MTKQTLGTRLRRAREAQGLGIRQLARLVDSAPSQVLRWETDAVVPSPQALVTVAEQLELRASDLFTLAGIPIPEDRASLPAMLRSDYDLPPEAIAEVEAHITAVAKKYGSNATKRRRLNTAITKEEASTQKGRREV